MKYNRIIGLLLIVCMAITLLGAVSAAEVMVNGEKFIVPDDFEKEEETSTVEKDSTGTTETAVYVKNMDSIIITVSSTNGGASGYPVDDDYKDKTINGTEGKLKVDEYGNEDFVYLNNQKTVYITLSPDIDISFEDIIIENYKEESSPLDIFN